MFYLSITRERLHQYFSGFHNVETIPIGRWYATLVTDNDIAHLETTPDAFSLTEDLLPHQTPGSTKSRLLTIKVHRPSQSLEISLPLHSPRPVYYHLNSSGELFCSTHISLLRTAGVPILENESTVPEYFLYRYVTVPYTLFKDIFILNAGEEMVVHFSNERCEIASRKSCFPFETSPPFSTDADVDRVAERVLAELMETIATFAPVGDSVATFLSGGMDSSILYAIARKQLGTTMGYSTAFPFEDRQKDLERSYAASAARAIGGSNFAFETTNEMYLEAFLESIAVFEEPLSHLQSVMFYLLIKEGLPDHKKIVLYGQGADTFFGIQYHLTLFKALQHPTFYRLIGQHPVRSILETIITRTGRAEALLARANSLKQSGLALDNPDNLLYKVALYGGDIQWVCQHFGLTKGQVHENRRTVLKRYEAYPLFDLLSITAMLGDIPNTVQSVSKHAEAFGKQAYLPFLTEDLMKLAFSVSWEKKLSKPKLVLREVAQRLDIPEFILNRRKSGFGILTKDWARPQGLFEPVASMTKDHFDPVELRRFQQADFQNSMMYWRVLNYVIWKRLVIEQHPIGQLKEELARNLFDQKKRLDKN